MIVLIVGIVLYETCILKAGSTTFTTIGFERIKPHVATIRLYYSGGNKFLTGVFTNGLGTKITLLNNGAVQYEGGCQTQPSYTPTMPSAGQNFMLTGNGCSGAVSGDIYTMTVVIPYTIAIGTITTTQTETGIIRGPME